MPSPRLSDTDRDTVLGVPLIRSIDRVAVHEGDKVRGSRFIADCAPATTDADALAFVDGVREREPGANHHCWAFLLAAGRSRSSDDGEPGGTAGEPILRHIGGSGLIDLVVVVTRYFGGTKLGMGGLVRAYGGAAQALLQRVEVVERPVVTMLRFSHGYDLSGPVEGVLAAFDVQPAQASYTDVVAVTVEVPVDDVDSFAQALVDATSGRVTPTRLA